MEQLREVRTRLLLDMSADFYRQMAELRALREALRTAEATLPTLSRFTLQSSGRPQSVSCALNQADWDSRDFVGRTSFDG